MGHRYASLMIALSLFGCGGEEREPPPRRGTATTEEPAATEPSEPAQQAPPSEPINLLTSVRTVLAVSSVYRDRTDQIARLVDGSLDSAWNSRTGDLEGSWIAVRLPENVTVTSIELTAGFTRAGGETDLFTGNHRITRVRVLREGEGVGAYPLNPESRELQTLPVTGGGGAYRIELIGLLPGSRTDWREVCISELRVMGRAEGAVEGQFMPRFAVDDLPEIAPETPAVDHTNAEALLAELHSFATAWIRYDRTMRNAEFTTGDPEISEDEAQDLREQRQELYERIATLVTPVDAARASQIRQSALSRTVTWSWSARRADLDEVAGAIQAVVDANAAPSTRCGWASEHVGIRLHRINELAEWERERTEWSIDEVSSFDDEEEEPSREVRRAEREADAAEAFLGAVQDLARDWSRNPSTTAPRIRSVRAPTSTLLRPEWDALGPQVAAAQQHCAWVR